MKKVLLLIGLLLTAVSGPTASAAPQDAVVRIDSLGGSGTIIWTGQGKSYILSAAHMAKQGKAIKVSAPDPSPSGQKQGPSKIIAVDQSSDLCLIVMQAGPLPYVCPVAQPGHRPGRLLSCGYDNLKWPSQKKETHLLAGDRMTFGSSYASAAVEDGVDYFSDFTVLTARGENPDAFTLTRELPWHGRSGGGLIDVDNGVLIGVVSGYRGASPKTWSEVKPGACGVYSSHNAVISFLRKNAPEALTASGQQQPQGMQQYAPPQQQYAPPQQQISPPLAGQGSPYYFPPAEQRPYYQQQVPAPPMPPQQPYDPRGERDDGALQYLQQGNPGPQPNVRQRGPFQQMFSPRSGPACPPGGT